MTAVGKSPAQLSAVDGVLERTVTVRAVMVIASVVIGLVFLFSVTSLILLCVSACRSILRPWWHLRLTCQWLG
jgi:hypothetical protein